MASVFCYYIYLMKLLIINGPNLNLIGTREPAVYGSTSLDTYLLKLSTDFSKIKIDTFQSNIEGELIDALQNAEGVYDGIILNAAAYTHTSIGIGDAVKAISTPVVEVHISNTMAREGYRHTSFISAHASGVILGFGLQSYQLAIQSFLMD